MPGRGDDGHGRLGERRWGEPRTRFDPGQPSGGPSPSCCARRGVGLRGETTSRASRSGGIVVGALSWTHAGSAPRPPAQTVAGVTLPSASTFASWPIPANADAGREILHCRLRGSGVVVIESTGIPPDGSGSGGICSPTPDGRSPAGRRASAVPGVGAECREGCEPGTGRRRRVRIAHRDRHLPHRANAAPTTGPTTSSPATCRASFAAEMSGVSSSPSRGRGRISRAWPRGRSATATSG